MCVVTEPENPVLGAGDAAHDHVVEDAGVNAFVGEDPAFEGVLGGGDGVGEVFPVV